MEQGNGYVPVFVDNTDYVEVTGMTRYTYMYVESTEPNVESYMISSSVLPLLFTDFEGVIMSCLGGKEHFDTPDEIKELFDFIDEKKTYEIDTSYFWLPDGLRKKYIKKDLTKGDVLRVYTPLFLRACRHLKTPEQITTDDMPPDVPLMYLSEKETYAFKAWTDQTIERVKKRYREEPAMNLRERQKRKEG